MFLLLAAAMMMQPPAPVWFQVANEGQTVASTAAVTYRYGAEAGKCAAAFGTCQNAGDDAVGGWISDTKVLSGAADNSAGDPAQGQVKVFQIQETSAEQHVTVDGQDVTVPALPAPPPPPTLPPTQTVAADGTLTVTMPAGYGIPLGKCAIGSAGAYWYLICNGPIQSNGSDTNVDAGDNSLKPAAASE